MAEPRRDRAERWLVGAGLSTLVAVVAVVAALVVPVAGSSERATPQAVAPLTEDSGPAPDLPPYGVLAGVVTDDEGAPVEGVRITVHSDGSTQAWRSDSRGRYRIDLPAGTYRVSFGGPGGASYAQEFHPDVPSSDLAEEIEVEADDETVVDAEVGPGARISGRVFDSAGRPVSLRHSYQEFVTVEAWLPTRQGGRWTAMDPAYLDGDGRYALAGLPAGRFRVRFAHPRSGTVYAPSATRSGAARQVRLAEGERRSDVDLRVPPPATLSGRVLTADGLPMAGVDVTVWSGTHPVRAGVSTMWVRSDPRSMTTGADGRYEFAGLGSGTYQVSPEEPQSLDSLTASPCSGSGLRQESVRVDAGRSVVLDLHAAARGARPVDGSPCRGLTRTDAGGR